MRWGSTFSLWHVVMQLSQHRLLKRLLSSPLLKPWRQQDRSLSCPFLAQPLPSHNCQEKHGLGWHPRPPTFLAQAQHLWVPLALLGHDGGAQLEAHVFQEPLPGHKRLPLCRHQRVEGAVGNLPVLRHSASHRGAPAPNPGEGGSHSQLWPITRGRETGWGAHILCRWSL